MTTTISKCEECILISYQRFNQIIAMKEFEKQEAQANYDAARIAFQNEAETLYALLKRKETLLEEEEEALMESSLRVSDVQYAHSFIDALERKIQVAQERVIQTRSAMQTAQQVLLSYRIDIRKYETVRDQRLEEVKQEEAKQEMAFLDELSLQLYIKGGAHA
ncbi:MAG: flagellar export protein FliJ [Bacilli bacterium]